VERAQRSDPGRYAEILAAAAANAFFQGDFDRGRRYSRESVRIGPTAASASPSLPFQIRLMFVHPDRIPSVVAEGMAALDAIGAKPYEYVHLRSAAASMAALGGNLDFARAEAVENLTACRVLAQPTYTSLCLYALGLAIWRDDPAGGLSAFEESIALMPGGGANATWSRQLAMVAQIRAALGEREAPFALLSKAVGIAHDDGDRPSMVTILAHTTEVLASMAELSAAAVFAGMAENGIFSGIWALPRHEVPDHEKILNRLRASLGDIEYADRIAEGAAMTYDEMVTFARRTLDILRSGGAAEDS
jgi:hypothetical protein